MEEKDKQFLKQFDDGKKMFTRVLRKTKMDVVIKEEDDFVEDMGEHLMEEYGLSEDDGGRYAGIVYNIWEECGCSMTPFDQEIQSLKSEIFS